MATDSLGTNSNSWALGCCLSLGDGGLAWEIPLIAWTTSERSKPGPRDTEASEKSPLRRRRLSAGSRGKGPSNFSLNPSQNGWPREDNGSHSKEKLDVFHVRTELHNSANLGQAAALLF